MLVNEEGLWLDLPLNTTATVYSGQQIVGNALVLTDAEAKRDAEMKVRSLIDKVRGRGMMDADVLNVLSALYWDKFPERTKPLLLGNKALKQVLDPVDKIRDSIGTFFPTTAKGRTTRV